MKHKLILVIFIFTSLVKAQLCLNSVVSYSCTKDVNNIVNADFNNDGNLDIAHTTGAKVLVYLANSNGSFSPAMSFTNTTYSRLVDIDINNDGNVDLIGVNAQSLSSSTLFTFLGTGTGNFNYLSSAVIPTTCDKFTKADFNNDGNIDIAIINWEGDKLTLFLGNGISGFVQGTVINGTGLSDIIAHDLNGDGNIDIAVTSDAMPLVTVFLGIGNGSFATPRDYNLSTPASLITKGDFNGDAKIDLGVAYGSLNSSNHFISTMFGDGKGSFSANATFTLTGKPSDISSGDINSDGKEDIFISIPSTNSISIYMGSSSGILRTPLTYSIGQGPSSIAIADFNGDTRPDIAATNNSGGNLSNSLGVILTQNLPSIVLSTTSTSVCLLGNVTLSASGSATSYSWSDGINNGVPFMPSSSHVYTVIASAPGGCSVVATSSVYVSDCNYVKACFVPSGTIASAFYPRYIVNADFNSDGYEDIIITRGGTSYSVELKFGNGIGGFGGASYFTSSYSIRDLITNDFNNDGHADLLTLGDNVNMATILLGNGAGSFATAITFTTGNGNNYSAISGDFNGDGKIDLAITNSINEVSILLGDGTGNYLNSTSFQTGNTSNSIITNDFNNDGILDLCVTNEGSNNLSIFLGIGNGSFMGSSTVSLVGESVGLRPKCRSADFNNDGIIDLLLFTGDRDKYLVFLGLGSGNFDVPLVNSISTFNSDNNNSFNDIICEDFNNDGNIDIALSGHDLQVLTGTGYGNFVALTTYTYSLPSGFSYMTVADFNEDTRPDIVTTNYNYINYANASGVSTFINKLYPSVSISGATNICLGNSTTLTATGANTYVWTGGITNGVSFTPSVSAMYKVTAIAANGCKVSDSVSVIVNPYPNLSVMAINPTICEGQATILVATGAPTYSWSTGAITSSITITPSVTTTYSVITNSASSCPGSINSATITQYVNHCSGQGSTQINYQWAYGLLNGIYHEDGNSNSYVDGYVIPSVFVDKQDNLILYGEFGGTIDFDLSPSVFSLSVPAGTGASEKFIAKYTSNGILLWVKSIGSQYVQIHGINSDQLGNLFISGVYHEANDFDPSSAVYMLTPTGTYDAFFMKLDPSGNFIWARSISGSGNVSPTVSDIDNSGNIYFAGEMFGTSDFDPSNSIYNLSVNGIFLAKYNSYGNLIWAKNASLQGDRGQVSSLKVDNHGNILINGIFYSTGDFLGKYDNNGNHIWTKNGYSGIMQIDNLNNLYFSGRLNNGSRLFDMDYSLAGFAYLSIANGFFISKYDESGNYVWAKGFESIGDGGILNLKSYKVDDNGEIYLTGELKNTQDIDPSSIVNNLTSVGGAFYFAKLSSLGNYVWAKYINDVSSVTSMAMDSDKNLYFNGEFSALSVDFDPSASVANLSYPQTNTRNFVAKYGACTPPSLSVSPATATVCLGSSILFNVTGATTYTWNNGDTTLSITPTINTKYSIIGTDNNNCSSTATISVSVDNTCQDVWPGDANSDGIANNLDVLELGLRFNQTGPQRSMISNNWQSYFANNWLGTISNGKNLNHSDCNGDGTINNDDTLAIYNNYGLVHAFKSNQSNNSNAQIKIIPDENTLVKGAWGSASIYLGDTSNPIRNLTGLAFTINYDNNLIEPNQIYLNYANSFIDVGPTLKFRKTDFANNRLYAATTHTTNNYVSGYGLIAKLHYQLKSTLTNDEVLNLGITETYKSDRFGTIVSLTSGSSSVQAVATDVGVQEFNSNGVYVSPNPTSGELIVSSKIQLQKIEIINLTGQLLITEVPTHVNHKMNLEYLTNGIYFINIYHNNRVIKREKVVVTK